MSRIEPFRPGAEDFKRFFTTALEYWPVLLMGYAVVSMVIVTLIAVVGALAGPGRLRGIPDVHKLEPSTEDGPVAPVPARLIEARFRYPGADHDALTPLSMTVDAGEHVAVTGANGSGKTTLMLLLSGREPTSGTIDRPGAVGLGRLGGTAVVLQHPESQVLGTRVADDVVWGLRREPAPTCLPCSTRWAWPAWPSATPAGCPAASCSGWRWRRRWHGSRRC